MDCVIYRGETFEVRRTVFNNGVDGEMFHIECPAVHFLARLDDHRYVLIHGREEKVEEKKIDDSPAQIIKNNVVEMQTIIFDNSDRIPEQAYIELMNRLKTVYGAFEICDDDASSYYEQYEWKEEILYTAKFCNKTNELNSKLQPYMMFIEKYIHSHDEYITFCRRCKFNIFEYLSEDSHGRWYSDECRECLSGLFVMHEVHCQRCDYGFCEDCENNEENTFDEENMEFNILRNALVLDVNANVISCVDAVISDFPSDDVGKIVSKIIKWLKEKLGEDGEEDCLHVTPWMFSGEFMFKKLLEQLRKILRKMIIQ